MLRFHFFTAKQGTWVHKDDRGPYIWFVTNCVILPPHSSIQQPFINLQHIYRHRFSKITLLRSWPYLINWRVTIGRAWPSDLICRNVCFIMRIGWINQINFNCQWNAALVSLLLCRVSRMPLIVPFLLPHRRYITPFVFYGTGIFIVELHFIYNITSCVCYTSNFMELTWKKYCKIIIYLQEKLEVMVVKELIQKEFVYVLQAAMGFQNLCVFQILLPMKNAAHKHKFGSTILPS